jgi:hypothetical protein
MDFKIPESRFSVLLRVLGDEAMTQYERCIEIIGKTAVRMHDPSNPPGTAFHRKDRLEHSPLAFNYCNTANPIEPASPANRQPCSAFSSGKRSKSTPSSQKKDQTFDFDSVFSEKDSAESLLAYLVNDLSHSQCIVSLGKSDILLEVLPAYLTKAFKAGWRVKCQVSTVTVQKQVNFLGNEEAEFLSCDQALEALRSCEGLNRRRIGESVAVVTIKLESDQDALVVQMVDIPVVNKTADLLFRVLVNSDSSKDAVSVDTDKLVRLVKKSLVSNAGVKVLGNVYPTGPHFAAASAVLRLMEQLMSRRHRCETLCLKVLSEQVTVYKRAWQRAKDDLEILRTRSCDEKANYQEQIRQLESVRAQLVVQLEEREKLGRESVKEDSLRDALAFKDAEINDLKEKLQNQVQGQVSDLQVKQLAAKDSQIRDLLRQLELERGQMKTSLGPSRSLSLQRTGGVCLVGGKSDRNLLADMLKASWSFTDSLVTQMKQSLEQEQLISLSKAARLKSRAARTEVDLKYCKSSCIELSKLLDATTKMKAAQEIELKSLKETLGRREEKVRSDFKALKENAKAKIAGQKERAKALTHEIAALRAQVSDSALLRAQLTELQAQCESWQFTASRHKEENEAAMKEIRRLEEQVAQLRELRKPLRPR